VRSSRSRAGAVDRCFTWASQGNGLPMGFLLDIRGAAPAVVRLVDAAERRAAKLPALQHSRDQHPGSPGPDDGTAVTCRSRPAGVEEPVVTAAAPGIRPGLLAGHRTTSCETRHGFSTPCRLPPPQLMRTPTADAACAAGELEAAWAGAGTSERGSSTPVTARPEMMARAPHPRQFRRMGAGLMFMSPPGQSCVLIKGAACRG